MNTTNKPNRIPASAGSLRLASSCAGRTRHRANREVSGVLLPSRQVVIQVDEPCLVTDLSEAARATFGHA